MNNKEENKQQYTIQEQPKPEPTPPTLEELLKPLGADEVMMYVKDPDTGDYKPHVIAKALPRPSQIQANEGSVVNVNSPDEQDGWTMVFFKLGVPAFFSFMIISLCCYKIVYDEQTTPELRTVYWSSLTATAASWMPSATSSFKKR